MSWFAQPFYPGFVLILCPDIRWAFTGPLVLWFCFNAKKDVTNSNYENMEVCHFDIMNNGSNQCHCKQPLQFLLFCCIIKHYFSTLAIEVFRLNFVKLYLSE